MNDQEPTEGYYGSCGITLEDQHGAITEEEYFERLAHRDALECSMSCLKFIYEHHTGNCPLYSEIDRKIEANNQSNIDIARGK